MPLWFANVLSCTGAELGAGDMEVRVVPAIKTITVLVIPSSSGETLEPLFLTAESEAV